MTAHDHHGHDHEEASELSETELRVRAIQTILVEKGYTDAAALDAIVEAYETKIGPHIGARCWTTKSEASTRFPSSWQANSSAFSTSSVRNPACFLARTWPVRPPPRTWQPSRCWIF